VTLDHLGLQQHISKPTRKGKKLIDHIITNIDKIHREDVLPCDGISHYNAPYIVCNIRKPRFEPRYKYIRTERNLDVDSFKSDIEKLPKLIWSTLWKHPKINWIFSTTYSFRV